MPKGTKLIYEAKLSLIGRYGLIRLFLCVALCWLVIPLICLIVMIVSTSTCRWYIYEDRIVRESGVFSKHQSVTTLPVVLAARLNQTSKGRMFNFGNINIDILGVNDSYSMWEVKDPVYIKSIFDKMVMEDRKHSNIIASPPPQNNNYY